MSDTTAGVENRSGRKRKAIMEAAMEVFLRNGYVGASMDEVAAVAGVSKQTVYKHFSDKEGLFTDIVLATIDQVGVPLLEDVHAIEATDDLEPALRDLAQRLIEVVMAPQVLRLRRLVTGEAGRFPELGRSYYARGPVRTAETFASSFGHLAERGLLRLDDPMVAAFQFIWLVVSIPLNEVMLSGDEERFSSAELEGFADGGVRVFLAAYGER
jgi:TetR/AcrR family transcriptional repressor of mexJK operon